MTHEQQIELKELINNTETERLKVYISGKISGYEKEEAMERFVQTEILLKSIGMEPVNPMKNGLPFETTWSMHMIKDIELLFQCKAIFMHSDWVFSKGAQIEKYIAERTNKIILFESDFQEYSDETIHFIETTVEYVTGLKREEYRTRSKRQDLYFARLIFAEHCSQNGMNVDEISNLVGRDQTTVSNYRSCFEYETRYNRAFRKMAEKVDEILKNKVSV